jgi:hypothetical protein
MSGWTLIDQAMAEAVEDRQRQRDRDHGDADTEAWGRRWLEAKRRGGEDRELDWYRRHWR